MAKQVSMDELCINTIRTLSMVQQANSGHPGTPMPMAPVVSRLWQRFLRFDPEDPIWPNRDRFVFSIGPPLPSGPVTRLESKPQPSGSGHIRLLGSQERSTNA